MEVYLLQLVLHDPLQLVHPDLQHLNLLRARQIVHQPGPLVKFTTLTQLTLPLLPLPQQFCQVHLKEQQQLLQRPIEQLKQQLLQQL